jgi:hypothetical protein
MKGAFVRKRIPIPITLALAVLLMSACAKKTYVQHPGALNIFDSQAYDTLLVSQDALNSAKAEFAAGRLPASVKPLINGAVKAYNVARASWLTYRATQTPADQAALQKALVDLTAAVAAIPKSQGGQP